jgi:hypothetical protein
VEHIIKSLSPVKSVFAAATSDNIQIKPQNASAFNSLVGINPSNIVTTLITFALVIGAVIAFFFLVFGGIKWITSGGDKESTAKAQGTITAALVGLAIVFAAWAILKLIGIFFGIDIFGQLAIPTVNTQ